MGGGGEGGMTTGGKLSKGRPGRRLVVVVKVIIISIIIVVPLVVVSGSESSRVTHLSSGVAKVQGKRVTWSTDEQEEATSWLRLRRLRPLPPSAV